MQRPSEGREIPFDSNNRLRLRRRRLIELSVISLCRVKEAEEFTVKS